MRTAFCLAILFFHLEGFTQSGGGPISVLNFYYAHDGMAEEVLHTRIEASRIRLGLGLAPGRILKRINDAPNLPDVIWECRYPDVAAHDADMAARADSDAFSGIRSQMQTRVRRFERTVWRMAFPARPEQDSTTDGHIVVTNWYFAKRGLEQDVHDHRIHASEVLIELGFAPGLVLDRVQNTGYATAGVLPNVIWMSEYPDLDSRQAAVDAVSATTEFQAVMDHMGTLLEDFDRGVWAVQSIEEPDADRMR